MVISHQERIMELADVLMVIADGKVRNIGTREEILPQLSGEFEEGLPFEESEVTRWKLIDKNLLKTVAGISDIQPGAFSLRKNGQSVERKIQREHHDPAKTGQAGH